MFFIFNKSELMIRFESVTKCFSCLNKFMSVKFWIKTTTSNMFLELMNNIDIIKGSLYNNNSHIQTVIQVLLNVI